MPPQPTYIVVVNHEDQYSIWPTLKEVPAGWTIVGEPDSAETGLARIEELWTDMRPRSVRQHLREHRDIGRRSSSSSQP